MADRYQPSMASRRDSLWRCRKQGAKSRSSPITVSVINKEAHMIVHENLANKIDLARLFREERGQKHMRYTPLEG